MHENPISAGEQHTADGTGGQRSGRSSAVEYKKN